MPVITLTTEWKTDDVYYGIIRGKLSCMCPKVSVIDNATGIPPFNISHASYIIRNTFNNYPEGSVHIICVHTESNKESNLMLVKARQHFFIGTDNGIFNLILNSEPEEIVCIGNEKTGDELEVFSKTAAEVLSGKKISEIGTSVKSFKEKVPLRATIDKDAIIGSIIFIDSYGNAITNITSEVFHRVFENREFRILIQSNKNYTNKIHSRYSDVPVGEMVTRFNSMNLLEIAINGADVAELLSIKIGSVVRIDVATKTASPNHLF